jgi:predicted metal-dependent enzyme (double-stranded beta helix superfamily)/predicted enzyme related to lactoylglutathione lyase
MATVTRPLPAAVEHFVDEITRVVAATDDRADTINRLYPSFAELLSDQTWLHPDHRRPIPGQFSQYAIYRAEDGSLSIMAMVVPSGVGTPVHDHRAWGLVGVYQGQQREKVYRRADDGANPDFADLRQVAENVLKPGDITTLLPPEGDIHMIETISDEPSISIHVLGNDIGCVHRHRYDVEHKTVHRFKSGYVNTACTAYRLAYQHLVVADVPSTVDFYERVFGAVRLEESLIGRVPLVRLDLHGSEIWVSGAILPGLQTHYGLVADDFDQALAELETRGVRFVSEVLHIGSRHVIVVTDHAGQQLAVATRG